ncbi:MAG: hypothetical protein V1721_08580 [Pseudomonadota bacterium]
MFLGDPSVGMMRGGRVQRRFYVGGQESVPNGLAFGDSGAKMYVLGQGNNTIYQYNLSTAWDVLTAAYAGKSFSVQATAGFGTHGVAFYGGNTVYALGNSNRRIYQYTLGTAWDISTASYTGKSFSVATQETDPRDLFISPDGAGCLLSGGQNKIQRYNFGIFADISTLVHSTTSPGLNSSSNWGLTYSNDGMKCYTVGTSFLIEQYSVASSYATSLTFEKSLSVPDQTPYPTSRRISSDGLQVYTLNEGDDLVRQYTLNIALDISTGVY